MDGAQAFRILLSLAASLAIADPAGAVLRHYRVYWTTISTFNTQSPTIAKYPPRERPGYFFIGDSRGIIDDTNNNAAVLRKLKLVQEFESSVEINCPGCLLFISMHFDEGPSKALAFTGTGDAATAIAWGVVTGWTITGGFWCHSNPSFLCTFARGEDLATVEPNLSSNLYDLGTWTFHGTGFTSVPFVHQVAAPTSMSVGNVQYQLNGRLASGIVPALPVLGVALLGASLLFAGARLSRGR